MRCTFDTPQCDPERRPCARCQLMLDDYRSGGHGGGDIMLKTRSDLSDDVLLVLAKREIERGKKRTGWQARKAIYWDKAMHSRLPAILKAMAPPTAETDDDDYDLDLLIDRRIAELKKNGESNE